MWYKSLKWNTLTHMHGVMLDLEYAGQAFKHFGSAEAKSERRNVKYIIATTL